MTRIVALLNFYDEPPKALALCIEGLARADVDHLVAVDGAYRLYPGGRPDSPAEQRGYIDAACRHFGIGLTIHTPDETWAGNEIAKRTFLFGAGLLNAYPGDWFMVLDADTFVTESPSDLKALLAGCGCDVAEVNVIDAEARAAGREDWPARFSVPIFFRAQPIHVESNHYTYIATETGRVLWGKQAEELAPGFDLRDKFTLEHHHGIRTEQRRDAKAAYYRQRDDTGLEVTDRCQNCKAASARTRRHGLLKRSPKIKAPVAEILDLCEACAERIDELNRRRLRTWGFDPDVVIRQRYADARLADEILGRDVPAPVGASITDS